jgi:hypothetical protein
MKILARWGMIVVIGFSTSACDWLKPSSSMERQAQNILDESLNAPTASDEFLNQFKTISCTPDSVGHCDKDICTKSDKSPYMNVQYNVKDQKYVRIGKLGERDEYDVSVRHGGIYTYISKPSGGMVFKVSTNGLYSEALSMTDTWIIYHGKCNFVR